MALSCVEVIVPENDVTPVIVAENQMYAEVPGLGEFFSWAEGDKLQVAANGQTVEFAIMGDYALTGAKFTGQDMTSDKYTISFAVPEGDSRMPVTMVLENVDTYKNVVFSSEWAQEHGGTFKMNNIYVLDIAFPSYIKTVSALELELGPNVKYSLTYDNKDVSALKKNFVVYIAGTEDVELTADQLLKLTVVSGEASWMYVLTGQAQSYLGGCHSILVPATGWEDNFTGKGSKYDPLHITNKQELLGIKDQVTDARMMHFVIDANIDLAGEQWTPICTNQMISIDGGNHTISNLTVAADAANPSFVGVLNGTVKNIKFDKPSVENLTSTAKPTAIVASTAGLDGTAVIENVTITGGSLKVSASTASPAGFIAAKMANATVKNCTVDGTMTHAGYVTELDAAGFIGQLRNSTVEGCTSKIECTVSSHSRVVASFIASIRSKSAVTDCHAEGNLNAVHARYSAGFIGYVAAEVSIRNCSYKGNATRGSDNFGGMFGAIRNATNVVVENCHFVGNITGDSDISDSKQTGKQGGLIGYINTPGIIRNCSAKGHIDITYAHDYVGGLIGQVDTGADGIIIEGCSFDGQVGTSKNRSVIGGIAGHIIAPATVRNCWSTGKIVAVNHSVGGIVGSINSDVSVLNCWSDMALSKVGHGLGGIVGRAENHSDTKQGALNNFNNTISGCIYWGDEISTYRTINPASNHSAGAIVGKAAEKNVYSNNWRKPSLVMEFYPEAYAQYNIPYDNEDTSADKPLTFNYDAAFYMPYHGKAASAGETASDVAKRIGWDQTVWDLSGDMPVLK